MATLLNTVLRLKIWKDTRGQELVEYGLIAAFLVAAGGAISPAVASDVSNVFSKVTSSLAMSANGSGQVQ
jgi:pilus assembly protein Flp/PilA